MRFIFFKVCVHLFSYLELSWKFLFSWYIQFSNDVTLSCVAFFFFFFLGTTACCHGLSEANLIVRFSQVSKSAWNFEDPCLIRWGKTNFQDKALQEHFLSCWNNSMNGPHAKRQSPKTCSSSSQWLKGLLVD